MPPYREAARNNRRPDRWEARMLSSLRVRMGEVEQGLADLHAA